MRSGHSVDGTEATVGAGCELISPYGGALVDLLVRDPGEREELARWAKGLSSIQISARAQCDLELLATGAFSPLDRFVGKADYRRILEEMRLAAGTLFPIPVGLPIDDSYRLSAGQHVALRSSHYELLAVMLVEEIFQRDPDLEAHQVCGTTDVRHPLVAEMASWGRSCISGPLRVLQLPKHRDFSDLRASSPDVRVALGHLGRSRVVAFHTRTPMHRVHEELTKRALEQTGGTLLLQPVLGPTESGDIDHFARVRTYKAVVQHYLDARRTVLNLLPLATRWAGPREAVWHAIIRRNYGATDFIVGPDHASPDHHSQGRPFYERYAAQDFAIRTSSETGVGVVPQAELVYLPDDDRYDERARLSRSSRFLIMSDPVGHDGYRPRENVLPSWSFRREVAAILSSAYPARHRAGCCVWFTGRPCAGKSTIAEILTVMLMERGRTVTLLDGDVVRTHLSKGLGFGREDRDRNIHRIGFVAAEIVRHHGTVICAAVSPYESTRSSVRHAVGRDRFVLAYVNTSLEVCEERDIKGLYAQARRGELPGFTGIDDPYEEPLDPDLVLTTTDCSPDENALRVVDYLIEHGYLKEAADPEYALLADARSPVERLNEVS